MSDALKTNALKEYFSESDTFNAHDLAEFYKQYDGNLNNNTLLSRIYNLKQKGIIASKERGAFTLGNRSLSAFIEHGLASDLSEQLQTQFPHIKHCVWSTSLLDKLSDYIAPIEFILIETDKQATESVFDELKVNGPGIFLEPDQVLLERYIPMFDKPVIIHPLISEAPLESKKGHLIPTPEKIIVDLICEPALFSAWQGTVLRDIVSTIYSKLIVNKSALFRYARRRNREEELKKLLRSTNYHQL